LCGLLAWLLWLGVHLVTLNGFRNRITVTLHWTVTFVLGRRSERVTTRFQARHTEPVSQALPRRDRWTG
jgi:NADH dehydrogenase